MASQIIIDRTGGPEELIYQPMDLPDPQSGQIIVENRAIGLNFIDIYQRKGLYPMNLPGIPGGEGSGVVKAVGDDVTQFIEGDRVAYLAPNGAYASYTAVPAVTAYKIPDKISCDVAASIFLKGMTAQMLVRQAYQLQRGQTCLVYAAAGGVGSVLCQWANHIGARVIGVIGSVEKTGHAKFFGATNVINRNEVDNIAAEVRKLTNGQGVHVVYDSIGAATFTNSLDALAPIGMMVSYGNASGPPPPIAPLELMNRGSLSLTRPSLFHYATPENLSPMADDLFSLLESNDIKTPQPSRFPLQQAADAQRLLESGQSIGPIILIP